MRRQAWLEVPTITLVVRLGPAQIDRLPLEGHTLAGALGWVRTQLEGAANEVVISQREHLDLPESGLMSGGAFERPTEAEFYLCPVGGHIELGGPPESCPICGAKGSKYVPG